MTNKRRIAFCSELGSGSGHLTGLLAVADVFVEQGDECAFIIPDVGAIARLRPKWSLLPNVQTWNSPHWIVKNPEKSNTSRNYTFADVLTSFGFTDVQTVSHNISSWNELFCAFQPAVIVTEFAPGALIAARGRVPCIAFGNGYYVLPKVVELPSMTSWDPEVPEESRRNERSIMEAINVARLKLGLPALESLSDAFRGDITFPCTFATLDPYQGLRSEPTYVPFNIPFPRRSQPSERSGGGFVYFSFPHPVFDRMLSVIMDQKQFHCTIFAPGYGARLKPYDGRNGHEILLEPMDLQRLSKFEFCVHHGGMGIASAGAIANIPQFITPVNLEHALTASSLRKQGAAIMALPETILAWQSSGSWIQAISACLNLPMNLHTEFKINGLEAALALRHIKQQVQNFLQ